MPNTNKTKTERPSIRRYPTTDELATLKAMAAEGCSTFAIANALHAKSLLIKRWAKENEVAINKNPRRRVLTENEVQTLTALVNQGLGKVEIMKKMGLFPAVLNRELDRLSLVPVNHNPPPVVLSDWQKERIKQLFDDGCKIAEIAKRVGISPYTLPTKIKEMGLSRPLRAAHYQRRITNEEKQLLEQFAHESRTQTFICKALRIRPPMLKRWLKDLGLEIDSQVIVLFVPTTEQQAIIDKMIADCKSMRQIAATLGISRNTISNYFQRNNISRPKVAHSRPKLTRQQRSLGNPKNPRPTTNNPKTPKPKPSPAPVSAEVPKARPVLSNDEQLNKELARYFSEKRLLTVGFR
jgi:DNA-binding NarL/FixJ family response regulator